MATVRPQPENNGKRHPWEQLEWILQLLYWVRPGCQNWNEAADEMHEALIVAAKALLRGRVFDDMEELAKDIAQEWWRVVLSSLFKNYDPDSPLFPYAYKTLKRICQRHCRRIAIRELPGLSYEPIDHRCNPRRDERRRELRGRIGQALWKLSKKERQAIVRRFVKGESMVDDAERQGCTANALYLRILHGLANLAGVLADLGEFFRRKR
jgi:RNA polymerase sigma factor (sigma-70 family)